MTNKIKILLNEYYQYSDYNTDYVLYQL